MAKAHEEETGKPHRALTPEEMARHRAAADPNAKEHAKDPAKDPAKETTKEKAAAKEAAAKEEATANEAEVEAPRPIGPMAIDYDRDGFPDGVVGRAGRNLDVVAVQGTPSQAVLQANRIGGRPAGAISVGTDTHRQDQVGYRDRLRMRQALSEALADGAKAEELGADPAMIAAARQGVPSHGSTGIAVNMPPAAVRLEREEKAAKAAKDAKEAKHAKKT